MIEIKVTGESAKDVIKDLHALTASTAVDEKSWGPVSPLLEAAQKPKAKAVEAPKAKAPEEVSEVEMAKAVEETPAVEEKATVEETPAVEEKAVELSDVQNALADILKNSPALKKEALAVLQAHNAKRVSDLAEADYAEVKAQLESLGD